MAKDLNKTFLDELNETISQLREFIQNDGGDIEFKEFKNGVLTLYVLGHCVGCGSFDLTFTTTMKPYLMSQYPDKIKDVIFEPKKQILFDKKVI